MACEAWKGKLDAYGDGELPQQEMRAFDAHVRGCPSCSADLLASVQMKRNMQAAGKRFVPSAEFRKRMQLSIAPRSRRSFGMGWVFAATVATMLVAGTLTLNYVGVRSGRDHVLSEVTDLHVEAMASASPVDVVSTDRHTVKPWFQGKIPFAFDLPELQNSEFTLLGGRMTYLEQTPGAHLVYDFRKHHISVFIFPEAALGSRVGESNSPQSRPFNLETWSQGGLRYFVIGDANAEEIHSLVKLFKQAAS